MGNYKSRKPTVGDAVYELLDHIHTSSKVYPTLATGVTVSGGAAWTLGEFTEIVPANSIASPFDIHFLNIAEVSAADTYELVLYAVTTEIGRIRFTRALGAGTTSALIPFMTPMIAKKTQIQAKIASASGGDSCVLSIFYHTY
jgi:hypothetical protein